MTSIRLTDATDVPAEPAVRSGARRRRGRAGRGPRVAIAVTVGGVLFTLLPHRLVQGVVALMFLVGALMAYRDTGEEDDEIADDTGYRFDGMRTIVTAFVVIFIAEWGDLMHRIDETSPLFRLTADDVKAGDMRLVATLTGMDETFAASVTARHHYAFENILFDHRFVDMFSEQAGSRELFEDMRKFHLVERFER